ncbi:NAD(P)H-hydrate epimerase [Candidatus Woesearchaeota archaeon]|nr:NAD(P)H-hydrate epimerase [Candidatus Woesearchaeota archaeon]
MNSLFVPVIGYNDAVMIDSLLREKFKLSESQLVVYAGLAVSQLAKKMLDGRKNVLILAGPGNNGADALCAGWNLHTAGYSVSVFLACDFPSLVGLEYKNLLENAGIVFHSFTGLEPALDSCDIVIDGLVGYNLQGNPRGIIHTVIEIVNKKDRFLLSIDVPTGYELRTGLLRTPHISSSATLCLGLVKEGLDESFAGVLYAGYIGIPPALYSDIGVEFDFQNFEGVVQVESRS